MQSEFDKSYFDILCGDQEINGINTFRRSLGDESFTIVGGHC